MMSYSIYFLVIFVLKLFIEVPISGALLHLPRQFYCPSHVRKDSHFQVFQLAHALLVVERLLLIPNKQF